VSLYSNISENLLRGHWLITAYVRGASASTGRSAAMDTASEPTAATSDGAGDRILDF